jgi:putative flippase GtrA
VSSVSGLYERFRHLIHEGAKFLTIGAIGTIVTFGVANALRGLGNYKAVTIATILATIVTYLGNRYWTFRHRQSQGTARDSIMFFVMNGIGLLIYYCCIGLTDLAGVGKSKLWYNVALVVGTGLGTLFRFWSYRKWVWTDADAGPGQAGGGHSGPPSKGGPGRTGVGIRPHGRHAANGHGSVSSIGQESLPDAEVSETSAQPR